MHAGIFVDACRDRAGRARELPAGEGGHLGCGRGVRAVAYCGHSLASSAERYNIWTHLQAVTHLLDCGGSTIQLLVLDSAATTIQHLLLHQEMSWTQQACPVCVILHMLALNNALLKVGCQQFAACEHASIGMVPCTAP